ncbi:MAG TPA: pyridoxal phosphate-dependent aminotransferase family protein [Anaeromyxobacter sp.]|nr:pyridoxal phosphate-dependent aminotransferase family protein [Anaeromyxobacter sp.]
MDVFAKCAQVPVARQLKDEGFDAFYRVLQSAPDAEVVVEGRRLIMLGSNNYLGLADDPRVKQAAAEATAAWGAGTTGSRCLNGTLDLHAQLEQRLAQFFGRDEALFFTSGYMANLGVIAGLAHRGDVVIVDRRAHASILDGCRLSTADVRRFRHNDPKDLERVLGECGDAGKLVVVDGVYSMEGDLAPLPAIVAACRAHGARLVLDDAHGLGVLGRNGRGTAEHFHLEDEVDVLVGTTSKSLPGLGGFAVADRQVIDYLRYGGQNRPFIFAASPPAGVLAAVSTALRILEEEPERRRHLWKLTRRARAELTAMGYDTGGSQTPIIPVVAGSLERTFEMWKGLTAEGLFVNVVLPPAVPAGGCLIRMTLTAALTDAHLDRILDAFQRVGARLGIIPGAPRVAEERRAG